MAVWLVRAGKYGEDEDLALEQDIVVVGWHETPDVSSVDSFEAMKEFIAKCYPDDSPKTALNSAAQMWAFSHRIQVGDIAVLPLKTRSVVALAEVTGPYEYRKGRHVHPVKWIRTDVPRTDFGQDLLYSMGAFMTVCQISRNNAAERFQAVIKGGKDPGLAGAAVAVADEAEALDSPVDLEEQAYDQIRMLIEAKFKGHNLTRLVDAILVTQGYQTYRSPAGPDGGVDILAGHGAMGFERPRICVQVKSGGVQNDAAIRELEGVMSRLSAEQGLFVSWDGFNTTALKSARDLFFKVRLWDDKKLIAMLLENYEKLPDEIQAELPLKRIWVMVAEE